MNHWLPLLVKNFAPFWVMVGIAATDAIKAEEAAKVIAKRMMKKLLYDR